MSEQEQSGKNVIGSKGRSSEMNDHQGSKTRLGEAIPDSEDNAIIDKVQSTRCVGTPEIQGEKFCNFNFHAQPKKRTNDWVPKSAACRNPIRERSSLDRSDSMCNQESDQQGYSSDQREPGEVNVQPEVDTNLSTIPEIPRNDLSIIKSLNSTLGEEQSNGEEMVRAQKGSTMPHIPGTEGKANESNKPFIDTSNATGRKPAAYILSSFFTYRQPWQAHSKFLKRSEDKKSRSSQEPSTWRKLVGLNSLARKHRNSQSPLTASHICASTTSLLG